MARNDTNLNVKNGLLTGLGLVTAAGLVSLSFSSGAEADAGAAQTTMTLTGVVRDFRERTADGGHPDFERKPSSGFGHYMNNVADTLDSDGKPVFTGAGRKVSLQWTTADGNAIHPDFADTAEGDSPGSWGVADPGGIESETTFRQWFRDVPGVNASRTLAITLEYDSDRDIWYFDDRDDPIYSGRGGFFPINNDLFGNSDGDNKNFHFTFELDTEFQYQAGRDDFFRFIGDDDVWVFIDGRRVIDIGGVHAAIEQTVLLDRIAGDLGLVDGEIYDLKFFFAERHRTQSNFRIETSFPLRTGKLPATSALFD